MKIYIYKLIDPRTNEIKYIGKTKNSLIKRLYEHLTKRNLKPITHKNNWIKNLLNENLKPIIELIEVCDSDNWTERETYYIKQLREQDVNLTNLTDGGDGALGSKRSKESIEKVLKTKLEKYGNFNHTEETKIKISEANKGKTHSKEQTEFVANKIRKIILQYDLKGNLLNEWKGIRKCANTLKINHSGILRCLNGQQKKYKGFIWVYKEN